MYLIFTAAKLTLNSNLKKLKLPKQPIKNNFYLFNSYGNWEGFHQNLPTRMTKFRCSSCPLKREKKLFEITFMQTNSNILKNKENYYGLL